MPTPISDLMSRLQPDPWRQEIGFSPEVEEAQQVLFQAGASEADREQTLNRWLEKHQTCIFGRASASLGWLSYCILTEQELLQSDAAIRDRIQAARTEWKRKAVSGQNSGFVILLASPCLANALPNETVQQIAQRISFLYLRQEAGLDKVLHDTLRLELPGDRRVTLEWVTGVNYFSAHGDRRWWQDHRIPGGLALSTNSVGHMIKAGQMANALRTMSELQEDWQRATIDSLEKALFNAMRTIRNAQELPSGKATYLLEATDDGRGSGAATCPFSLPKDLSKNDPCRYRGHYDTDFTLPSEYFRSDVERPRDLKEHTMDFTYLFDDRVENEDYDTMATGLAVRASENPDQEATLAGEKPLTIEEQNRREHKRRRLRGREVTLSRAERVDLGLVP